MVEALQLEYLGRLLVALVLSGLLGYERERARRPAGLRTHMTVGMAAALFVILAELLAQRYAGHPNVQADPIRVLEAVVAGISILGAGTIFVLRGKEQVRGLTTAASLLATAGVGVAAGIEAHVLAVGATILLLVVLALLHKLEPSRLRGEDGRSPPHEPG